MCVSAVTDEMIAAGSIVTDKKDGNIHITITDENGYNLSNNRYNYMTKWADDKQVISFYRSYGGGELYEMKLKLTMDNRNRYDTLITAEGVGQFTKTEVLAIVNAVTWQEYEVTEVNEDKYGMIKSIVFRDKEVMEEERWDAERLAKAKDMAAQLIH